MTDDNSRPNVLIPARVVDEKGRPVPEDMTDRELLEEMVRTLRTVGDVMAPFADPELTKLGPIGIMKALMVR